VVDICSCIFTPLAFFIYHKHTDENQMKIALENRNTHTNAGEYITINAFLTQKYKCMMYMHPFAWLLLA